MRRLKHPSLMYQLVGHKSGLMYQTLHQYQFPFGHLPLCKAGAEVLTGYRRYQLQYSYEDQKQGTSNRHAYRLAGVKAEWQTREMQAECLGTRSIAGADPKATAEFHLDEIYNRSGYDCTCGIYVPKQPDLIPDYHSYPAIVAVSAWGNYIEYERGYRVQFVRMEHIWIEPDWVDSLYGEEDVDKILENLTARYGVPAEIRRSAICCGQDHDMVFWPSGKGPVLICRMATSHIVNCLKYMKRTQSRSEWAWKNRFEKELKRREAKRIDGKTMVTF